MLCVWVRSSILDNEEALAHTWLLHRAINAGFESILVIHDISLHWRQITKSCFERCNQFPLTILTYPLVILPFEHCRCESRGWKCYSGGQIWPFTARSRLHSLFAFSDRDITSTIAMGNMHLHIQLASTQTRRSMILTNCLVVEWHKKAEFHLIIPSTPSLLNYMEHGSFREANISSASQEISQILWNPKIHDHIHKSLLGHKPWLPTPSL